jgi:protease-4
MIERILSARTQWALEPEMHNRLAEAVLKRLDSGKDFWDINQKPLAAVRFTKTVNGKYGGMNLNGNVQVLEINGVMTRAGEMCSYGTEDISAWIDAANANSNIEAIILKINSGGGDVDGTIQLGQKVKNSRKLIMAFVASDAGSAAYWVASQCKEVNLESSASYVGSIGVLAMHVDASQKLENDGYKVEIIRSDGSEDKALFNSVERISDEARASLKADMNATRADFISTVKAGRPKISEDVFSGKMYRGKEAIKKGMADRIMTLDEAASRALWLARKSEQRTGNSEQLKVNSEWNLNKNRMDANERVMAVFGGSTLPENLTDEQVSAIDTALTKAQADATTAQVGELAKVKTERDAASARAVKAENALAEFTETGLQAAQIKVLADWYNAENGGAPETDGRDLDKDKKTVSSSTALAISLHEKMNKKNA